MIISSTTSFKNSCYDWLYFVNQGGFGVCLCITAEVHSLLQAEHQIKCGLLSLSICTTVAQATANESPRKCSNQTLPHVQLKIPGYLNLTASTFSLSACSRASRHCTDSQIVFTYRYSQCTMICRSVILNSTLLQQSSLSCSFSVLFI